MVFNTTVPRRPVTASYTGPGPCYDIPGLLGQSSHDPRSAYARAPAYHIAGRPADRSEGANCGPGPCYLPSAKVYCNGREVTPQCRIINRRPESTETVGPGPAAYAPVNCELLSGYSRPPAYTIPRAKSAARTSRAATPGPNAYSPDPMIGRTVRSTKRQSPGCVIRSRSALGCFSEDRAKTPGPGAYAPTPTEVILKRSPSYSITGRNLMPGDKTKKPGPGAHYAEKATDTRCRSSPAFSFGVRHSPYALVGHHSSFADHLNDF